MEPGVVVALIETAFASLIDTFGKASFDAYQKRQESRRQTSRIFAVTERCC